MKLSIIVTVYNIEKYIEKCLSSIQNQTYKNFECIVVNDGSIDESVQLVKKFENDNRFVLINKENGGVSSARNLGIDNATGEYIVFVDGDDFLDETMLQNIVQILEESKADTIFSGYKGIYDSYEIASIEIPKYEKEIFYGEEIKALIANFIGYSYEDLYNKLNGENEKIKREFAAVWRFVYKTKVIKENNLYFDEKICFGEDILFNSMYLSLCKKLYISKNTDYNYIYRNTGLVQEFLHEDGVKLLEHKLILMEARQEATDDIFERTGLDILDMWQGSIIFSSMHIGLALTKMKGVSFWVKYKMFKKYVTNNVCTNAYSKLCLNRLRMKYKLCFFAIKIHLYLVEYVMLNIASKLGISPEVEG